jgi:hypothetical protein
MKSFKTKVTVEEIYPGTIGLTLNQTSSNILEKEKVKRVLLIFSKSVILHSSVRPLKNDTSFFFIGKKRIKELNFKVGETISVTIKPDDSEFQFEDSAELLEVLKTDKLAAKVFNKLTPGNKRSLLYLVNRFTSSDKRIETALHISYCLKANITSAQKISKTKKSIN